MASNYLVWYRFVVFCFVSLVFVAVANGTIFNHFGRYEIFTATARCTQFAKQKFQVVKTINFNFGVITNSFTQCSGKLFGINIGNLQRIDARPKHVRQLPLTNRVGQFVLVYRFTHVALFVEKNWESFFLLAQ